MNAFHVIALWLCSIAVFVIIIVAGRVGRFCVRSYLKKLRVFRIGGSRREDYTNSELKQVEFVISSIVREIDATVREIDAT